MKPKVDFCFKELMEDAEIREGFLSALLKIQPEEIKETELLTTHLRREHPGDKLGILDIRILVRYWTEKEQSGLKGREQVNLEVQIAPFPLWPERSIFYLAKMYTGQMTKGQDYDALQKCVHVGILDFVLFEEDEEFYSCIHFWEDKRRRMYTDKLEIHILELPKLAQREYPETDLLNWARFFNAEQKEEFEMAAETNPYIEKAYERLTDISADEEMRLEYEAREKAIRDHNYLMKTSLELGWKQGMEKGLEEGLEQGVRAFIECYREDAFSREKILERLITKFSFTADEAEVYLERYWK